jgi:Protein of unknown function (DUF742)
MARPFSITRGRTRSGAELNIEDLVVTTIDGSERLALLHDEHHLIASLCVRPRSVAEVSAIIDLPIGVSRVVIGDLVLDGLARVYASEIAGLAEDSPEMTLVLERLIDGLRTLH